MQTVDQLVNAARGFAELGSADAAMSMFGRALDLDPDRLELHVEIAQLELVAGDTSDAFERLESLADVYLDLEMADKAADIISFIETLGTPEAGAIVEPQSGVTQPMTMVFDAGVPHVVARSHTEFCSAPILLFPDGSPLPGQSPRAKFAPKLAAKPLGSPSPLKTRRRSVNAAKLSVPAAPPLRAPKHAPGAKVLEKKKAPAHAAARMPKSLTDILPRPDATPARP